ncbi:hypothetical protein MNV49_006419 [Pseudohyphozyma bogoriensis]|nr:hypothetical protein MNV49_006419 [Pseudohyphozyma bogoriensis]
MASINETLAEYGGFISNNLTGCTDLSQISARTASTEFYHRPDGACFPISAEEIQFHAFYGYVPSYGAGIAFTVLFGLLTVILLGMTIKSKRWWYLIVPFGAGCEFGGWIGRTMSATYHSDASNANYQAFLCQIVMLTICPVFFSGACYGLYVVAVKHLDPTISAISPRKLTIAFVICDIVSLLIQAAGGGLTSSAKTKADQDKYTHVFVAGIIFQLVVMLVFSAIGLHYYLRLRSKRRALGETVLPGRLAYLVWGIAGASFLIIVRGAYRTAELAEGWSGYLIEHEGYFIGLDATMMLLCLIAFALSHPVFTCPKGLEDHYANGLTSSQEKNLNVQGGTPTGSV